MASIRSAASSVDSIKEVYAIERRFDVSAIQRVTLDLLQFLIGQAYAGRRAGQSAHLVPTLERLACRFKPNALTGSDDQYVRHNDSRCRNGWHHAHEFQDIRCAPNTSEQATWT